MRTALVMVMALVVGCGSRGEQHTAFTACRSDDKSHDDQDPVWCGETIERILRDNPDITLDQFEIVNKQINGKDFASVLLLYRGTLARTK